jgi:hypothetical protein
VSRSVPVRGNAAAKNISEPPGGTPISSRKVTSMRVQTEGGALLPEVVEGLHRRRVGDSNR